LGFGRERGAGELRVAGSEDPIGAKRLAQVPVQRRLDVEIGHHGERLGFERAGDRLDGRFKGKVDVDDLAIGDIGSSAHRAPPSLS